MSSSEDDFDASRAPTTTDTLPLQQQQHQQQSSPSSDRSRSGGHLETTTVIQLKGKKQLIAAEQAEKQRKKTRRSMMETKNANKQKSNEPMAEESTDQQLSSSNELASCDNSNGNSNNCSPFSKPNNGVGVDSAAVDEGIKKLAGADEQKQCERQLKLKKKINEDQEQPSNVPAMQSASSTQQVNFSVPIGRQESIEQQQLPSLSSSRSNSSAASSHPEPPGDNVAVSDEAKEQKKIKRQQLIKEKAIQKGSPEFQARLALALSGLRDSELVQAHDLLVECNQLSNPGKMQKYGEGSHTTPKSKAKHMQEMISEMLYKAEQYSKENADKLAAMLADKTAGRNWQKLDHIFWPWKNNSGAKDERNEWQKDKSQFHHQTWLPECLLTIIKQKLKIRPIAMDQKCAANNAAGVCIIHYTPKKGGAFDQQMVAQMPIALPHHDAMPNAMPPAPTMAETAIEQQQKMVATGPQLFSPSAVHNNNFPPTNVQQPVMMGSFSQSQQGGQPTTMVYYQPQPLQQPQQVNVRQQQQPYQQPYRHQQHSVTNWGQQPVAVQYQQQMPFSHHQQQQMTYPMNSAGHFQTYDWTQQGGSTEPQQFEQFVVLSGTNAAGNNQQYRNGGGGGYN